MKVRELKCFECDWWGLDKDLCSEEEICPLCGFNLIEVTESIGE